MKLRMAAAGLCLCGSAIAIGHLADKGYIEVPRNGNGIITASGQIALNSFLNGNNARQTTDKPPATTPQETPTTIKKVTDANSLSAAVTLIKNSTQNGDLLCPQGNDAVYIADDTGDKMPLCFEPQTAEIADNGADKAVQVAVTDKAPEGQMPLDMGKVFKDHTPGCDEARGKLERWGIEFVKTGVPIAVRFDSTSTFNTPCDNTAFMKANPDNLRHIG